jgi:hypothetical protein
MANTRFKTENGLLVTGGNAEFVDVGTVYIGNTTSRANLFVEGDLIHVNGNLVVTGVQQIVAGQVYTGDILAGADGLNLGNSVNQFNAHIQNAYVYEGLFPVGNTVSLGNTTNRWVGHANSLDVSTTLSVTGPVTLSNTLSVSNNLTVSGTLGVTRATTLSNTLLVTGAVTLSNTLTVANAVTLSNTLSVANAVTLSNTLGVTGAVTLSNNLTVSGILTATSNVNLDSGVLFVDGVNSRVGINNTAPGVALRVTGAVDISSTANIQGNANVAGTLGVNSAVTLANTLAVTGTTTLSNNLNVSSGNVMITSACTHHVSGNVNFSSSSLYVDAINSRVGIGTSSPDTTFKVSGSANITGATVLSNTLNVVGAVSLSNALSVSGNTTLSNAFITAISANGSFGGSGQFLTSNSTGIYWSALSGGSIGGTNTQVQFNDSGSFGATAGFTFNKTTNTAAIGNTITVGTTSTVNGSLANLQALNVVNQTNTGTLFVTTSANVGTAFTANSTLTNTVALNVVNQTNTSTLFVTTSANVGSFGTTNGTTINTTRVLTGNSVANATHAHNLLQVANSTGTANLTATTLAIGSMTVNSALANLQALNVVNQTNTGTLYATTSANVGAFAQINSVGVTHTGYVNAASIIGGSTNSNFDSGVLFVDAVNNRVGINNTAPGVALRVTGAVDISSAANVAGTLGVNSAATLANTLVVTGATTIANTLTLNDTGVLSTPIGLVTSLTSGKNHQSSAQFYNILAQTKIVNTAMAAGRTMVGLKAEMVNESIHTDGVALFNPAVYGTYSYAYNGNTTALTDARTTVLYGMYGEAANYANGSVANTVGLAAGGTFIYESSGSGVTTNAHGAYNVVQAANNTITGNITTAYGVRSQIKSNTAMTIGTGYLFHGQHVGSTTTEKYGVFVTGESNNYFSGNVHVAGTVNSTSYRIGTDTLVVNSTTIALGPLATTNGVSITTTSIDVGNSTANASLDHNIIFVTNSSSRANLTPTTLAIGSITVNSALANLQALNVVNQTNTGTLFVTTSANVGTAFTANSTLANAIALNVVNQTNTSTLFVTTSANVGAFAQINSVGITHTGYVNAASIVGGTTNSSFDSGVLFVDAVNNRVGINNTAPGVALRVTGAADISSTANIQGNANVGGTLGITGAANALSTFGITGAANALGTLGVNGLLTAAASLNVTGSVNASANLKVGTYATGVVNGVNITNNALTIGNTTANAILTGSSLSINSTSASLNVGTSFTVNSTVLATSATTNVNIDSGALFVDATNSRVGINNTAPGVALRVTGAVDISSTANVQGNANVDGTLGVAGLVSLSNNNGNTFQVGSAPWSLGVVNSHVGLSRTIDSSSGANELTVQIKSANATVTAGRNHFGIRQATMVEHEHKNSGGTYLGTSYFGIAANVYNGNSSIGGDSRVTTLMGIATDVANYANGSSSNAVGSGLGGSFSYEVRGSGVTTNAWGARGYIDVANNSVTGNITTAYGVDSRITSNTAMTIATGYLYYGEHNGSTTTNKYGVFLTGESNNYFSGNVHVAGTVNAASYRLGTSTLVVNTVGITHTGFANVTGSVNSAILSVGTSAIINSIGITHTGFANVTGSANVGGTLRVAGAANALSTLGITGAANALGTLGVNGLLTAASNLNVTNQTNTGTLFISTSANVGTIGTSNGVFVNSTLIMVGNSTSNTRISSNGVIVSNGVFTGNGAGLTSTTYVSTYSLGTDTAIFNGGDSATWKLGGTYTPTIDQGVSTLDIQVYAELYFRQFAENVSTGGDIYANASSANIGNIDTGFGGGNPLFRYRLTKTYSGGNTTLYTSDYITISAAGTIAGQFNTIRDTTPSVGSGSTYRMEYEWVTITSIPTSNLGTVSVQTSNQTMIGVGTEFQAWVNPRNTITIANSTGGFGTGACSHAITAVRGPTSILLTAYPLEAASGRTFRINDPLANVNMTQLYLSLGMTGYK